jgi:hypothetical protein
VRECKGCEGSRCLRDGLVCEVQRSEYSQLATGHTSSALCRVPPHLYRVSRGSSIISRSSSPSVTYLMRVVACRTNVWRENGERWFVVLSGCRQLGTNDTPGTRVHP